LVKTGSVLQVITDTDRRGGQVFASDLQAALVRDGVDMRTVALAPGSSDKCIDVEVLGPSRRHPETLRRLRAVMRDSAAVIGHGSTTLPMCVLAGWGLDVPFVYRTIGDPSYWVTSAWRGQLVGSMLRRAARHVTLWPGAAQQLMVRYRIPVDRIDVIPNGVPSDRFPRKEGADVRRARQRIGVSVGSINHLYVLGMLEDVDLSPDDVELVNLPPPEMPVSLETQSVDAISIWEPWPTITLNDVEGSHLASRGGGYVALIGYIVALRDFVEENPDVVERFLTARAQADLWIRENPEEAAEIVVRWFPGTDPDVAGEALQHNLAQIDPRMSACNYLAAHTNLVLLQDLDVIDAIYDVNDHFEVRYIHNVLEENPELVEDLDDIPEDAAIEDPDTYEFVPEEAEEACPE
jgi:hypothetical protein